MNFSNIAFIVICVISCFSSFCVVVLFLGVKITPKFKWDKNYSIKKGVKITPVKGLKLTPFRKG